MAIKSLFPTLISRARLAPRLAQRLNADLEKAARGIAAEDRAGQVWSRENFYAGYTSYASLDDLTWRNPAFAELETRLRPHAGAFARAAAFDLGGKPLRLDSLWINILAPGGSHSGHIHPHAVISGTYYVRVPEGSAAIRFEDPRHPLMMAAPLRRASAPEALRPFVSFAPKAGELLLWESWLRHEVPRSHARTDRISISFNYRLG